MGKSAGARNTHDIFRLKKNTAGTAWEVMDKLTDVVAPTPTNANAAFRISKSEETKPEIQTDDTVKFTFTQYESGSDIFAFIDKVKPPKSIAQLPDITYEDGTMEKGASSSEILVIISYLHYDDLISPTKIFTYVSIATLDPTSGSTDHKSGEWLKPVLIFNGSTADLEVSVLAALFDATLVTQATAIAIPAGDCYKRQFITKV
ncbi:MAG: hypothetical protein ABFD61_03850 [Chloroherpetonaceae bacterium]|jgi:hypothetical protein